MPQYLDKKQIRKRKNIFRNMIGFGLFFVVSILGLWGILGGPLTFMVRPIWKIEKMIVSGFNNMGYFFNTRASLYENNSKLKEDNFNIKLSMVDYEILKQENLELKRILNRLPENREFILASILTKPNQSLYDTLIIDVGEKDGIREGNLIYANGETPIGKISKIYKSTSLAVLFSNPKEKTEGYINIINANVELLGRGGGNFEMIIPMDLSIEKEAIIYIPGNSSAVLALVDEVISSPSDPFKKVILKSPVNIQNLKWVQVRKD